MSEWKNHSGEGLERTGEGVPWDLFLKETRTGRDRKGGMCLG